MAGKTNQFYELFTRFSKSANKFKRNVCIECGWSETTFYKKMRADASKPGGISIAEAEKIRDLAWEVQQGLKDAL
ncbi:MAG TPA: hypothetical protein VM802_19300 [Chitinophaga sp.]|uniref:hypothetical protein n=1 Tax=Chitinophaga sp. TaxID=1869181 RepID=UPI002C5CCA1C|nr:hypothetical protein [Chitinophaga sp.]HVI47032.1 hypothetical protein [Chitinophaga sp.]